MKKLFFFVFVLTTVLTQKSFSQDTTQRHLLTKLLTHYYGIKDGLVAGNVNAVSSEAEEFIRTANGIDYKIVSEGNINTLLKDATSISEGKDIKKQREIFANFSSNMAALAKSVNLSARPVYQAYCPMKKAGWLTDEKTIKNPYYGSSMLTCGSIVETIE